MLRPSSFRWIMQEVIRADTQSIIDHVKQKALDIDAFYNHVFDDTIKHYYESVLAEVASDLLALPVEREYIGLEPLTTDEDVDDLATAVIEISLIVSAWFLKDPKTVEVDITNALTKAPAEDIRESRFLRRQQLLH